MFNVFGTVLFTVICMATPLTGFMQSMTPDNPAAQIANMHTLFNIVTTLLLLPFGGYLVKIAMRILPDRKEDKEEGMHLAFLVPMPASKQEHPIGFSAMYVTQIRQELNRMMGMAKENIATSFQAVLERDVKRVESAEATEEYIDYLNKETPSTSPTSSCTRPTRRTPPQSAPTSRSLATSSASATMP